MRILVIHGPNLNLLGQREPEIYGTLTLQDINKTIRAHAKSRDVQVEILQSNHEGEIVDRIQKAAKKTKQRCSALVINPGAFTHYSLAIRDVISAVEMPAIEVHLSNIAAREEFRRHSVIAPVCLGQISGLGGLGYLLAVEALLEIGDEEEDEE